MKNCKRLLSLFAVVALFTSAALAQNVASNKAAFSSADNELQILASGNFPSLALTGQMKTSSVGDLMIGVSMECALWTTTRTKTTDVAVSTSRAAVNVTVEVDGVPATPGQVVYCDREIQVKLTRDCGADLICDSTDTIILDLFEKTKNAQHFNFLAPNRGSGVHTIVVKANGIISEDPDATLGDTKALIGKRTLVVEEFNSSNQ